MRRKVLLLIALLGLLGILLVACGASPGRTTQAAVGRVPVPPAGGSPTAPSPTPTLTATQQAAQADLRAAILRQVDEYAAQVTTLRQQRGCDSAASPTARSTPTATQASLRAPTATIPPGIVVATAAGNPGDAIRYHECSTFIYERVGNPLRDAYPEFADYWRWMTDEANCRNPGRSDECTLMAVIPSPEEMRDPARLARYLADAVRCRAAAAGYDIRTPTSYAACWRR